MTYIEHQGLIHSIRSRKLTYLSEQKLSSLAETCVAIEKSGLEGIFIEAGCALGGSAILIASLKSSKRPLNVYDVFGLIPPPTKEDPKEVHDRYQTIVEGKSKGIKGDIYYGYITDLYELVKTNFSDFGIDLDDNSVSLIQGLVQETMIIEEPVACAHIDVDWYSPVKTCLDRIAPWLVCGGSIILDDYHFWGGCRKATDEFLKTSNLQFLLDDSSGAMKMTKIDG